MAYLCKRSDLRCLKGRMGVYGEYSAVVGVSIERPH